MTKIKIPAQEKKQKIIECAASLFAKKGFDGTRTRDIAKTCGISEAALYSHFKGKEDLFLSVVDWSDNRFFPDMSKVIEEAPDGFQALKALLTNHCIKLRDDDFLPGLSIHNLAAGTCHEFADNFNREKFLRMMELTRTVVKKGIEDGSIRSDLNVDAVTFTVRGVAFLVLVLKLLEMKELVDDQRIFSVLNSIISLFASKVTDDRVIMDAS